jgi:hypothetical protein
MILSDLGMLNEKPKLSLNKKLYNIKEKEKNYKSHQKQKTCCLIIRWTEEFLSVKIEARTLKNKSKNIFKAMSRG